MNKINQIPLLLLAFLGFIGLDILRWAIERNRQPNLQADSSSDQVLQAEANGETPTQLAMAFSRTNRTTIPSQNQITTNQTFNIPWTHAPLSTSTGLTGGTSSSGILTNTITMPSTNSPSGLSTNSILEPNSTNHFSTSTNRTGNLLDSAPIPDTDLNFPSPDTSRPSGSPQPAQPSP